MYQEQRDFVQQANVAVDLMKLTISQTMDSQGADGREADAAPHDGLLVLDYAPR